MKMLRNTKLLLIPAVLLLAIFLAMPAAAAEEIFDEPLEKPKTFYTSAVSDESLSSVVDLEAFKMEFLQQASNCPYSFSVEKFGIPYSMREQLFAYIWYGIPEAFHCHKLGTGRKGDIVSSIVIEYYSYADTYSEYTTCHQALTTNAEILLSGIKGNTDLNDEEKALLLHDRLAVWTAYDVEGDPSNVNTFPDKDFSAYGALGTRVAVCQGYAMAYMYLLDQVGIKNEYCSSDTLCHAWNIVYIDGKPYHVDVTWDDPTSDMVGRVLHDNFLRSTAGMKETLHTAGDYISTPVDTKYDRYYWQSSNAAFQVLNGSLYYIDGDEGVLKCVNDGATTTLFAIENDWFYYGHFSKLDCDEGILLYSTVSGIFGYDPITGENRQVYTFSGNTANREQIYGFAYEAGYLTLEIQGRTAAYEYYTTVIREAFDLLNALPKNGWYEDHYYENDQLITNAWREDEGGRFYLSSEGTLTVKLWLVHNGKKCYVGSDGYCVKNRWENDGIGWCWLDSDGYAVVEDWVVTGGKTYYCDAEGYRVVGVNIIDGEEYLFASDGALVEQESVAIVTHPQPVTTDSGNKVQFSVTTQGKVASYRWQYRKVYKWFDTTMTGYNTATLTVAAKGSRNGYDYRCIITFADGTVLTSEPAELTVKTYLSVTYHPNDQLVVLGKKGQFTAKASGEGLKFEWEYKRPDTEKWADTQMEGADKETVMIETTKKRDGYKYRCKITDVTGNIVYTNEATLRVLSVAEHPEDAFAGPGQSAQFTVAGNVSDGYKYRWEYSANGGAKWSTTSMDGYNTATLTVKATLKRNGYMYRCVLIGDKDSEIVSNAATLYVGNPVVINTQPADVKASVGDTATIEVNASNAYSYRWYYSTNGGDTWRTTSFDGAKTTTLYVPVTKGRNGYLYRCVIKGLDGKETITNAAKLTVE